MVIVLGATSYYWVQIPFLKFRLQAGQCKWGPPLAGVYISSRPIHFKRALIIHHRTSSSRSFPSTRKESSGPTTQMLEALSHRRFRNLATTSSLPGHMSSIPTVCIESCTKAEPPRTGLRFIRPGQSRWTVYPNLVSQINPAPSSDKSVAGPTRGGPCERRQPQ